MLREGVNIKVISQRLGHSNIGVTMNIYAHILPDQDIEAALLFERGLGSARDHSVTKAPDKAPLDADVEAKRL